MGGVSDKAKYLASTHRLKEEYIKAEDVLTEVGFMADFNFNRKSTLSQLKQSFNSFALDESCSGDVKTSIDTFQEINKVLNSSEGDKDKKLKPLLNSLKKYYS